MTTSGGIAVFSGARVMSADGKELGVIKEARADRFLVDVRWAPDYWLGTETVDNSTQEMVQLILTKDALGPAKLRHEVEGPGINSEAENFNGPAPQNRPPPMV